MSNAILPSGVISREELRSVAPSIFATKSWHKMSDRYKFIPTIEVVDMLADKGFYPVKASQSRSRIEGKGMFTNHLIRLRHEAFLGLNSRPEVPELVLSNAHDGTAAYRFQSGIFRLVCSNGMIVCSADFGGVSVKHSGGDGFEERVIDATYEVMDMAPKAFDSIERWKQIELKPDHQLAYANAAHSLRPNPSIKPEQLLEVRRPEDGNPDLWSTMNRVQESMVKGGIQGRSNRGRRTKTRGIKSVNADLATNKALWMLSEQMENILAGV